MPVLLGGLHYAFFFSRTPPASSDHAATLYYENRLPSMQPCGLLRTITHLSYNCTVCYSGAPPVAVVLRPPIAIRMDTMSNAHLRSGFCGLGFMIPLGAHAQ